MLLSNNAVTYSLLAFLSQKYELPAGLLQVPKSGKTKGESRIAVIKDVVEELEGK